jgi:murein DD-endopeptidase MepM/ murein hydrolase activator NlpD
MKRNLGIDLLRGLSILYIVGFWHLLGYTNAIPNYNNIVIIRHGEYLSVYSNLEEVFVKRGDEVEIKEDIGKVYTDPDESKTELHFELWKGKTLLNPELWLVGSK